MPFLEQNLRCPGTSSNCVAGDILEGALIEDTAFQVGLSLHCDSWPMRIARLPRRRSKQFALRCE